ncbi:MAG: hypothetical protein U0228_25395 [Myxococcaceae bacterium]
MKSVAYPRGFPVIGEFFFPPTMVMTSDGQTFSHFLQPMQASSPSASFSSAKLARMRGARGRFTSGYSTVDGLRSACRMVAQSDSKVAAR